MKDPLAEIEDRIRRKEEIVAGLAGRTIEAATLAGDESDGADVERLILTFSDGGRVVIESVDFESYRSWLDVT